MNSNLDSVLADKAKEKGYEYTAKYIKMFGSSALNPAFISGFDNKSEEFYKKCVLDGHPYDYYFEFPEGSIF